MDGGVHFAAGLRHLLAATGQSIKSISAFTTLLQAKLAPVDTVHATLQTEAGAIGTFSVSFGTEFKAGFCIEVVTTRGRISVSPNEVRVASKDGERIEQMDMTAGVAEELQAFVSGVAAGKLDQRLNPDEALGDLLVVESMLLSGSQGGRVQTLQN